MGRWVVAFVAASSLAPVAQSCTTILVGSKASADGSVMCSHTNDGEGTMDPRLVFVPAKDHEPGSKRPIYYSPEVYPRYVGYERGLEAYYPVGEQESMGAIGFLPQANHTFQYVEQTYAALNEKQVGMGESTCSCVDWTALGGRDSEPCGSSSAGAAGSPCALLSIDELSRVAMERASSAREAVSLMGALAVEHGFYGADSFEGSAESLMVVDKHDAWIFHILPHPSGASAVWVAQKIPDDHVAVVPNSFVVRRVNASDASTFLASDLAGVAAKYPALAATCPSNEACDFTRTFGDGEYAHKYYSGRRIWGMYRLLAPDVTLDPNYETLDPQWLPYPVSLPAAGLTLQAVLDAHRDHYEGTPFDLTRGLAAGPFGSPVRHTAGKGEHDVAGNWERAISLERTSDSHVVQARAWLPDEVGGVLWWGPLAPHATVYTPVLAGQRGIAEKLGSGLMGTFSASLFWKVRYVAQVMDLKWSYVVDDVRAAQRGLEKRAAAAVDAAAAAFAASNSVAELTDAMAKIAAFNYDAYDELFHRLMFKYADGYVNVPDLGASVGYPAWWLKAVNYTGGPPPIEP